MGVDGLGYGGGVMAVSTHYGEAQSRRYDVDFVALFGGADRGDLAFFQAEARRCEGAICEVGAGTGRVLRALAEVTGERRLIGVEPSPWMRARFEANLREWSPDHTRRAEVVDGEFTRIPLPDGQVGLVFAAFRSFQHVLEADEQVAALSEMKRVLRPGGRLALDAFDPPYGMLADTPERLGKRYRLADGALVSRYESRRLVREKQRVDVTLRWVETRRVGRRLVEVATERETYGVRYVFPFELLHLVARAGFVEVELFGGYDRTPITSVPRELIVTARRP